MDLVYIFMVCSEDVTEQNCAMGNGNKPLRTNLRDNLVKKFVSCKFGNGRWYIRQGVKDVNRKTNKC